MAFEQNDTSVIELSDVELRAIMATLQSSWPVRTTHRHRVLNMQILPEDDARADDLPAPLLRPALVHESQERVLMGAEDARADEIPPRPVLVRTITGMGPLVRTEMCVEELPDFTYEQLQREEESSDTPVFPGLPGPFPITTEEVEEIMQGLRSRFSSL